MGTLEEKRLCSAPCRLSLPLHGRGKGAASGVRVGGMDPSTTPTSPYGGLVVTEQEIESKVIEIVAQQMGHDKAKINRTMKFVEDLNADSLDQVELVMELEEAFETDIPDEQAEKIKTVGDAIEFIKQQHGVS